MGSVNTASIPQGPDPVAHMEGDVSMTDVQGGYNTSGGNVNNNDAQDDDELSEVSDVSSGTESSDEDPRELADWTVMGVDCDVIRDALDVQGKRIQIRRTPPTPPGPSSRPTVRPPPYRDPLDGNKSYIQWIPYWSDPNWNDATFTFDVEGQDPEIAAVPPLDKLRPALLPMDALRNPTHYAKRFGIHPHQRDGRSLMSPTTSTTRRALLSHVQETPTGRKNYVTIQDADALLSGTDPRLNRGEALESWRRANESNDHIEAYVQLHEMLEDDGAWQRAAFNGMTTDEAIAHGAHSDDPSIVEYDLDGPLHPLLGRNRWLSPEARGDSEEDARLHYNLNGTRGEWCAQNDQVWEVLQPALQLVTRLINAGHPYFAALVDAKSRRYIDLSRLSQRAQSKGAGSTWTTFTTNYDPTRGAAMDANQVGAQHIAELDKHGFSIPDAVETLMRQKLWLNIFSSAAAWKKGTTFGGHHITWGFTQYLGDAPIDETSVHTIVSLGAEMMWPLLMPEFTQREKASCTVELAVTLLHEIAHACEYSFQILLDSASAAVLPPESPLVNQPAEVLAALRGLRAEIHKDMEPFYEDDPRSEMGFACENTIFGGTVDTAFDSDGILHKHSSMMPIALRLSTWPHFQSRPYGKLTRILTTPPLPVDGISTLVPVEAYTKFFRKAFWQADYTKYGYQALKLAPETSGLTFLERHYVRNRDLKRAFGKDRGLWLREALGHLTELGHGLLYAYCNDLMQEKMESVWVRKRFHHERHCYSHRMRTFQNHTNKISKSESELGKAFDHLRCDEAVKWANIRKIHEEQRHGPARETHYLSWREYHDGIHQHIRHNLDVLVTSYHDVHHYFLLEIRTYQTLTVDYVQRPWIEREHLHKHYIKTIHSIIDSYEKWIEHMLVGLEQVRTQLDSFQLGSAQMSDDLNRIKSFFQLDLNHFTKTKFFLSDENMLVEGLQWENELETITRGRAKKKSETMKRLATKELLRAPRVARELVDKFLDIININKDDARNAEAELRGERLFDRLEKDVKPVEPFTPNRKRDWMRATPPSSPKSDGDPMDITYATPLEEDVRPWVAAPTPLPPSRSVLFGQPNALPTPSPEPPEPITPPFDTRTPNFTLKYINGPGFPELDMDEDSVLRRPASSAGSVDAEVPTIKIDAAPDVGFGGVSKRPSWGPFGTAYCDYRTLSQEVDRETGRKSVTPVGHLFGKKG